jgi:hypothetical protein
MAMIPGNRQMVMGNSGSNIVPFGSGGRGSIISSRKQVGGGVNPFLGAFGGGSPLYDETYDERTLNAESQYELAQKPWDFKNKVFGAISPLLTGLVGDGSQQGNFGQIGGSNTPLPTLPNSFVYSPDQIQQQVNSARAQGDQGAASQKQQIAGDLAGRGFSMKSPLAMALNLGADTGARMSNADQEREIRFGASGANAKQALGVGQLANQQWNDYNQADIARRKTQVESILGSQRNVASLLSILAGLA